MNLKKNYLKKSADILFLIQIFTLPFFVEHISNILIIITTCLYILSTERINKPDKLFLFLLFPMIKFVGIFYSDYIPIVENTQIFLDKYIVYIFYFICFIYVDKHQFNNLKTFFILGTLFTLITSFSYNFILSINVGDFNIENFIYHKLLSLYGLHSSYFSLYLLISLIFLLNNKTIIGIYRIISIVLIIIGLILLESRIITISAFLCLLFLMFKYVRTHKNKNIILFGFISVSLLVIFTIPQDYKKRFEQIYNFDSKKLIGGNYENGVTQRVFLWKLGINILHDYPLIGVGSNSDQFYLNKQLEKEINKDIYKPSEIKAIKSYLKRNLNLHNQYLSILVSHGLIGLFCFLVFMLMPLYVSYKEKNIHILLTQIPLILFCTTENVLLRNKGIMIFAFIYAIYGFYYFRCLLNEKE
ncbi:O-antigen ligase family protein [Flammeovirga sp. MY04]|uniref:O-antigen ligase family protein n=1 Tax=Flammeovirga sp. MY04 TaxID=1191459 RepID=UPI0008060B2F|nr:O-antigen ligase family protein [Flammeovirga sp. MY04]ANQ50227.1 O-antigen ligase family protein [Flammeovirga sp. MY04]